MGVELLIAIAVITTVIWFFFGLFSKESEDTRHPILTSYLDLKSAYPTVNTNYDGHIWEIYSRCIREYAMIVNDNPDIDAGHGVNHIIKVEKVTSQAIHEFYPLSKNPTQELLEWVNQYYEGDLSCLSMPDDVFMRIMVASLFHEVGDKKFKDGKLERPKRDIIIEVINNVFGSENINTEDFRNDIVNMVDYCSAGTWGDRIPPNSKVYQLIPRWADRLEATGFIGLLRTITFSFSRRSKGYPLVRDDDEFPTSFEELDKMAPLTRWHNYSGNGGKSGSGFSHYLDKIVHISGKDVPIPILRDLLNEGQQIVRQFVVDFTMKNGKKFDLEYIMENLDPNTYYEELDELEEIQSIYRLENNKWVK